MPLLRSLTAIVAGLAAFSLLLVAASAAGSVLLGGEPERINRSVTTHVVWLLWNIGSMVVAGHVAALLAARAPTTHAIVRVPCSRCSRSAPC
jgi:hypothetical protein